jgi:hypothetical protein
MRIAALAIAFAALAACSPPAPSDAAKTEQPAGGVSLPGLTRTAYRVEGVSTNDAGKTTPMVMVRDGGKLRLETSSDEGPSTIIINKDAGEAYVIGAMSGHMIAMRMPTTQVPKDMDELLGEFTTDAHQVGPCSAAGEVGADWEKLNTSNETERVCISGDGVFLRASTNGKVQWEATQVARGPQPADAFTVPAGVQVMDMGGLAAAMKAKGD